MVNAMAQLESVKAKVQLMRAGLLPVHPAIEHWVEKLVGKKMSTEDRAARTIQRDPLIKSSWPDRGYSTAQRYPMSLLYHHLLS